MSGSCTSADNLAALEFHGTRVGRQVRLTLNYLWLAACAIAGCRTAEYSAHNLPLVIQAPALPSSADINLEQMACDGAGTSQIGAGDLVSITIVSGSGDEKITPIPARVAEDGTVMVPLIGAVQVGGMEAVAAEQRIAAAAIERGIYRQPYVTLTISQRAVNRVTVLGAVAKPGVVDLPRGACDLSGAIAAAGGLSASAGTKVEILHRGVSSLAAKPDQIGALASTVHQAAYNETLPAANGAGQEVVRIDMAQAGPAGAGIRKLEDRDLVNVLPQEKRLIHVGGLVQKPNEFELKRDKEIRVLDAITMAGGTTSLVADKVYVIRQLPSMPEPAVIQVSLSRAKRDGNENLRLAEGDMVTVESTPATMTVDTLSKFFRVGLGLSGSLAAF